MANNNQTLNNATAAFGLAAAVTVLFNTLLAWVKDSVPALNDFMAALTGHHWITHGLADIVVFIVLGFIFMQTRTAANMAPMRVITTLVVAVVVAGLGLAGWFLVA